METQTQTLLPSPTSSTSSTNNNNNNNVVLPTTPQQKQQQQQQQQQQQIRSESNPYPTTFVQADTTSFKQVVQMLTGSSEQPKPKPSTHQIPPIKTPITKPKPSSKLYERRSTSLKNLHLINTHTTTTTSSFRNNINKELLSPSLLDFPALALSPVTPLIHDPFIRSPVSSNSSKSSPNDYVTVIVDNNKTAEEKAIAEKGFMIHHPSPVSTPRDSEPRLLPLFPVSSPRVPGSGQPSS